MKNRKWKIGLISILLLLFVGIGLYTCYKIYKENDGVRTAYCKIIERDNTKILLKQTAIDPEEYGTIYSYIVVKSSMINKFDEMVKSNDIDADTELILTFLYNNITDFKRKDGEVYFEVGNIIDVQNSGRHFMN